MKKKRKIICDLIHRYIRVTKSVETIINDESFQRLKHICQTTSYHLYPSTNHTRFEHSLGVMKLAVDFFNKLKKQFSDCFNSDHWDNDRIVKIMNQNYYHLVFASLLHDVGHAPLSHLCEDFYSKDCIKENIQKKLDEFGLNKWNCNIFKKGNPHELMSCLVILCNLYNKLNEIFRNKGIEIDYEYIVRIITGNKYDDHENNLDNDYWDRNLIISIVNSETIDVDKLDYLMRDNLMSGMVGPIIDIDRLLHSLVITKKRQLGFTKVGISTIQKIIECRDSIYLWVCNHHTVVYTDYLLQECIKHMEKLYEFSNTVDNPPVFINRKRVNSRIDGLMKYYDIYNENEGTLRIKNNISKSNKRNCMEILRDIKYLPYNEALNKDDYFSVDAILKKKITDNEIYSKINYGNL